MKAYTTKNWQTKGIQVVEGDLHAGGGNFVGRIKSDKYDKMEGFGPNQWHPTIEAANAAAEKKRSARIESLQKQIERLQAMTFVTANIEG